MFVYTYDIKMAVIAFPFVALLITFPVLLWHYHRFGAISRWSILMLYSFVFYLMCAYFLIILPLPSIASVAKLTTPRYNLHPLLFIREFLQYNPFQLTNIHTWLPAIKAPTVIQPVFNIFLTVPFGFYLRTHFKRSWWQTILMSFCLSLFFELTQLSGLYGIYPRPYRLFDVDDLLMNTIGGFLGFGLARVAIPFLPTSEHVMERLKPRAEKVSTFRHATAFVVDWLEISVVSGVVSLVLGILGVPKAADELVLLAVMALVVLLPELVTRKTLGLRVVHLQLADRSGDAASKQQVIGRFLGGYSLIIVWNVMAFMNQFFKSGSLTSQWIGIGLFGFSLLFFLVIGVDLLIDVFRPSHELLFEKFSRTKLTSTYGK
ncbi:hypothetical protein AYR62_02020 [Secundilactobacillus paracollinoides]|uniref:VanZ-like domain-containing protein n=1 Tax=Secundilactobacillus paracollinoides TaxID=240427 RepID=A0A1B2IUY5_9LACO|nr:VanZ family protein [Secundilactobacillus paracollinoides]ANZ60047.1 hypothetical protein AYR61_00910 [Secundilactobacillus paracollinoides]ANZ63000.1 hypothetical protein AYR62_02020 [Secundilactobacillus paracollinoides]ANZ65840.1 hypothetical protein AYR63_00925 [Secundilactobacillus paracollinoides]